MKTLGFSGFIGLAAALSVAVLPTVASGDLRVNLGGLSASDPQDVVVSLKVNPLTNPEQACLAVTLGANRAGVLLLARSGPAAQRSGGSSGPPGDGQVG